MSFSKYPNVILIFYREKSCIPVVHVHIKVDVKQLDVDSRGCLHALHCIILAIFAESVLRRMILPSSCALAYLQALPKDVATNFLHMFQWSLKENQLSVGSLGNCRQRTDAQKR